MNIQQPKILIVDDHRLLLNGTISLVSDRLQDAQIFSAQTAQEALKEVALHSPDLAIADLSIPQESGTTAQIEHGLGLLKQLMQNYPQLNLMVQSSSIKALVRLIPEIDAHQGGFTIADKSETVETFLTRMEWAMQGVTHTKDLQSDLEVKPEWLEVLHLAFEEGFQDKAIAQSMYKSERMIRHYWSKIQDALEIYPEPGKNIRALTQIRAREEGLLD
ncbi:MAG: response regulator transcription factor [Sphaerospermopsis sp. SIO1G2]|nr:response regulator transcription factor [Sphaerospermopsis sp. SIO1G1]NET72736.1 response regulator transcription factor [Sphaerospermopsis sp. SIO1G2]